MRDTQGHATLSAQHRIVSGVFTVVALFVIFVADGFINVLPLAGSFSYTLPERA